MTQANLVRHSSWALCIICVLATFAPTLRSQQDAISTEAQWANALLERFRYYDMAEKVFANLTKKNDADRRMEGFLGLAKLRRQLALASEDLDARQRLNEESLDMLRKVAKEISKANPQHWEAQFELADSLQDVAAEVTDRINRSLIPADKVEEARNTNKNRLEEAQSIYELAKSKFENADRDTNEDEWFNGRRAMLFSAIVKLRKAELIATDPTKRGSINWDNELTNAQKELEKFIWNHEDQYIGQLAYLWQGRVMAAQVGLKADMTVERVEDRYLAAIRNLISLPPEDTKKTDPEEEEDEWEWQPAPPLHQQLAQQSYWWLMEFLNDRGLTARTIMHGEKLQADWKKLDFPYHIYGRMALVQLAQAYKAEGRDAESLSLASQVSGGAVDAAKNEADKLVSVIIRTATDRSQFSPLILAAGANGAFLAKRRDGDTSKDFECIELYQLMLRNLDQVKDETERNDLGALAWYRIGISFTRLGRLLESLIAFENGYQKFNTEKLKEDPKITESMMTAYKYTARQFRKLMDKSEFSKNVVDEAERYIIAHPPKNVIGGGVDELQFNKGLQAFGEKNYADARTIFSDIVTRNSPFQERSMVKLALCEMRLAKNKENLTEEDWMNAATQFIKYKEYVASRPETDPEKLQARAKALSEADYYLSQCYSDAADATTDLTKKATYYAKILDLTEKFKPDTASPDLTIAMLWNKFAALEGLGRTDECEAVYLELDKLDPKHQITISAAVRVAGYLKTTFEKMPVDTKEQKEAMLAVKRKCADYYNRFLEAKRPKKLSNWTLVMNLLQDIGEWDQALTLTEAAVKEFEGTKNADTKDIFGLKRRIGKCLIEKAKLALAKDDEKGARENFQKAAAVYDIILKDPNSPIRGYVSVAEEAAEIYGGFVVGPNIRGQYVYYPGNGEYKKARDAWEDALKKLRQSKIPDSPAEKDDLEDRKTRAHFNILLLTFQMSKTESSADLTKWLRSQLNALFAKNPTPGGESWAPKYQWLLQQVGG